jgi:hypothetical protein
MAQTFSDTPCHLTHASHALVCLPSFQLKVSYRYLIKYTPSRKTLSSVQKTATLCVVDSAIQSADGGIVSQNDSFAPSVTHATHISVNSTRKLQYLIYNCVFLPGPLNPISCISLDNMNSTNCSKLGICCPSFSGLRQILQPTSNLT